MPTLDPAELAELQTYRDAGDVVGYYTYLQNQGFQYATMALGVVNNTGVFGQTAVA